MTYGKPNFLHMIDMYSTEVRANPYPAYEQIRQAGRAVYDEKRKVWFIGHYDEVSVILRDSKTYSNREAGFETTLHGRDGILHIETRKKLTPAFHSSVLDGISRSIERKAEDIVSKVAKKDHVEVVNELAGIVPVSVFSWMFGVKFDTIEQIRLWSDAVIYSGIERLPISAFSPWIHRIKSVLRGRKPNNSLIALHECESWLRNLFRYGGSKTSGWMFDVLQSHCKSGSLDIEEVIDIALLIVVAATETTTSAIANALYHIAKYDHLQDQLRNHPEQIEGFIEELLRYDGPVQRRVRYVAEPTAIGDVAFNEGDRLMLLIGSANRDPVYFESPDTFDIQRNPNRHLAFGAGTHFCLGSQLARLELRLVIQAVLQRTSSFKLSDPNQPVQHPLMLQIRGPRKLYIDFK